MPPAEPRWSCTIPSIHDDAPLRLRIYHPAALSRPYTPASPHQEPWRKRGIIMAHPYAPMGGSYDDRIVGIVVDEFLKQGWVVGTFNFRGASGGKTSWSGKPEVADYQSFAGLFIHYLSYLHPHPPPDAPFVPEQLPASPTGAVQTTPNRHDDEAPIIILGGYSYGSTILRHLPPMPSILQPFAARIPGSAADEIILKSHKLADQANLEFLNMSRDLNRSRKGHNHKLSVTMGGEETSPEKRRNSREIQRSLDTSRGHDIGSRLRSLSHGHRRVKMDVSSSVVESLKPRPAIQVPAVRYLLVSPLTPPTSTFVAPGLARGLWNRSVDEDVTIKRHETLAVFGDQDMFASAKKMRDWTEKIEGGNPSGFLGVEIQGAGHFWVEQDAERRLRDELQNWETRVRS